jgi:hypothetical protein
VPGSEPAYEPPGAVVGGLLQHTVASNPGALQVDYVKYFRSYPLWPTVLAVSIPICAVIGLLASDAKGWGFLIAAVALNAFYWFRVTTSFRHGCVNPAVVVSTSPYLVAVSTDMDSSGQQPWWVVKILRQPLETMTGGPPPLGTRLATVALYEGDVKDGHWNNFHPKVVNCATTNERSIQRIFASIPQEEWQALEAGLKQVPSPDKPGLYRVYPVG